MDGGAVNPVPYDHVREGSDITVAIDVSGQKIPPEDAPVPGVLESILSTFQIMEAAIMEAKKACAPPNIYIKPALENMRVMDYERYREIILSVQTDAARLKEDLSAALNAD